MKVVLQPCGDSDAKEHFVDTIQNLVPLADIIDFIPASERATVTDTFGDAVAVWGVTPAVNGVNAARWHRMDVGDIALLYRNKQFFFRGTIAYKVHSKELAQKLWSTKADGSTWEYAFFLTDLEPVEIPIGHFNKAVGFSDNYIVQGFMVLTEDQSLAAMEALDLTSPTGALNPPAASTADALSLFNQLQGSMDAPSSASRRVEQQLLRKILLANKATADCSLCGRELPVELLVIGHIKRRSSCTSEERRDLSNVFPVCLLGCDSLFEKGYVAVGANGCIEAPTDPRIAGSLAKHLDALRGLPCSTWSNKSSQYFAWHLENRRRFV